MNPIYLIALAGVAGYFLYDSVVKKFNNELKNQENKFNQAIDDQAAYFDALLEGNEEKDEMQSECYPIGFKLWVRGTADAYWAYKLDVTFTNTSGSVYYITNINARNISIGGNIIDGIMCSQANKQFAISGEQTLTISKQITALLFDTKDERNQVRNKLVLHGNYSTNVKAVIDWQFASVGNEKNPNVKAVEVAGTVHWTSTTGDFGTISKTWVKNGDIK
jgi:hypothetical protein